MVVLLIAAAVAAYGFYSVNNTKVDAIPDLSENQVIIFTEWMGRSPQIMEDQVTYPLVSNLQGIAKIKNIRANSMFGMSFVFVIFEDVVHIFRARTRVLERLNYAQRLFPAGRSAHVRTRWHRLGTYLLVHIRCTFSRLRRTAGIVTIFIVHVSRWAGVLFKHQSQSG